MNLSTWKELTKGIPGETLLKDVYDLLAKKKGHKRGGTHGQSLNRSRTI